MQSIKIIRVTSSMSYPATTVYEFESMKLESEVIDHLAHSFIYMICQRPVNYFDEVICVDGLLVIKIKQKGNAEELNIQLASGNNENYFGAGATFYAEMHFYDKAQPIEQPYRSVAGIKLFDNTERFIFWLTPDRLLFEYLNGRLTAKVDGDIASFLNYSVHYIGQAQGQNISKRLTGHEKLLSILASEHPFTEGSFSPYELSLIFLGLDSLSEETMIVQPETCLEDHLLYRNNNPMTSQPLYSSQKINELREHVVNDLEAYMINLFEPKYNKIQFKDYPNIAKGLKSIGYDAVIHNFKLFANFITESASYSIE